MHNFSRKTQLCWWRGGEVGQSVGWKFLVNVPHILFNPRHVQNLGWWRSVTKSAVILASILEYTAGILASILEYTAGILAAGILGILACGYTGTAGILGTVREKVCRKQWRTFTLIVQTIHSITKNITKHEQQLRSAKKIKSDKIQKMTTWVPHAYLLGIGVPLFKFDKSFARVAKCHGYDGYIRVKILTGWGKSLGEHANLTKSSLFGGRFVQD